MYVFTSHVLTFYMSFCIYTILHMAVYMVVDDARRATFPAGMSSQLEQPVGTLSL